MRLTKATEEMSFQMLDEENQNRGKGHVVVEDHGDEGDLSSDTDSDDDRRHTVNKAGIDAFVSGGGTCGGSVCCGWVSLLNTNVSCLFLFLFLGGGDR